MTEGRYTVTVYRFAELSNFRDLPELPEEHVMTTARQRRQGRLTKRFRIKATDARPSSSPKGAVKLPVEARRPAQAVATKDATQRLKLRMII